MEQKISFTFTPKSVSRHFGTTEEFVSEHWEVFEGWLFNHVHNNLGSLWYEDYDILLESINECLDEEITEFPFYEGSPFILRKELE
jgi:hypothetical protein